MAIKSKYFANEKVIRYDSELNYFYTFNSKTGFYKRTNKLVKGKETKEEIFSASFPHLIDVGIMGHCTHGMSGKCILSGVQCYQNGLNISKSNMSVSDFRKIAEECNGKCNQFALGGRGDPNEHENFEEILKISRENNIVPNYTTSGYKLTDNQISISKKYCGAVAVSWYRSDYTIEAIKKLLNAGVKTNIHYVLNKNTISEALEILETNGFPKGINAVVFLTHKPVGLGQKNLVLDFNDERVKKLFNIIKTHRFSFKVGVDGCFVVGLLNSNLNFNMDYLDTCEATRFTCYIDSELNMTPCSFDVMGMYRTSLINSSIQKEWNSEQFISFRKKLSIGCPNCKLNDKCHGGCLLYRDIVMCPNKND